MVVCKKCGSVSNFMRTKGANVGIYCSDCKSWIKWVGKNERFILQREDVPLIEEDEFEVELKSPEKCRKCGCTELFTESSRSGVHTGLYCSQCGAWVKWVKKKK